MVWAKIYLWNDDSLPCGQRNKSWMTHHDIPASAPIVKNDEYFLELELKLKKYDTFFREYFLYEQINSLYHHIEDKNKLQ